ncbi:MAG: TetR/AcrR family transcriptional regulator [Actinomycetota bacterium]
MASASTSDPKLALTRERILAEAVAFADEHGVDALTMRKLADRLGAGAMSLYTYVKNKDDMIEGMVDLVTAEIELPAEGEWRGAMRDSARSAHHVLLAHPWAAHEWTSRMPGPARLAYMESILRSLAEAGLDEGLVYRGYHAVTMHIVGFTIQELGYQNFPSGQDLGAVARAFLDDLAVADLPHLALHVEAHLSDEDHGDEFGFVLDLILDGLDRANGDQGGRRG